MNKRRIKYEENRNRGGRNGAERKRWRKKTGRNKAHSNTSQRKKTGNIKMIAEKKGGEMKETKIKTEDKEGRDA